MKKIIAIFLLLTFPLTSYGALSFTEATANSVKITANSTINNFGTGTVAFWIYFTTITPAAQRNILTKSTGGNRFVFLITNASSGTLSLEYGGGTQLNTARAVLANLPNYGANKWLFIVLTKDFGNSLPHLYVGDRNNPPQEALAYAAQQTGSGTHDDSASDLYVGANFDGSSAFPGKIAFFGMWNKVMTLGEIRGQWFRSLATLGNVVFMQMGFSGLTTQVDWSGKRNSGTITGASLWPHVPLGNLFGR